MNKTKDIAASPFLCFVSLLTLNWQGCRGAGRAVGLHMPSLFIKRRLIVSRMSYLYCESRGHRVLISRMAVRKY